MKFLQGLGVSLIMMAGIVAAQGGNPAGSSLGFSLSTGNTCGTPAKGSDIMCATSTGWMESHDGSAYAPFGTQGAPGPQGPPGVAGPVGPAGPPGTLPATITCSSIAITAAGAVLGGCH